MRFSVFQFIKPSIVRNRRLQYRNKHVLQEEPHTDNGHGVKNQCVSIPGKTVCEVKTKTVIHTICITQCQPGSLCIMTHFECILDVLTALSWILVIKFDRSFDIRLFLEGWLFHFLVFPIVSLSMVLARLFAWNSVTKMYSLIFFWKQTLNTSLMSRREQTRHLNWTIGNFIRDSKHCLKRRCKSRSTAFDG